MFEQFAGEYLTVLNENGRLESIVTRNELFNQFGSFGLIRVEKKGCRFLHSAHLL